MGVNIERFYKLSPLQEGMLYHKLYNTDSGVYFVQSCLKVSGEFDARIAAESINLMALKHDVLRTSFFVKNVAKPKQVVLKEKEIEVIVHNLSSEMPEKQYEQMEIIKSQDVKRGFDLEKDSLLRITIIKFSNDEYKMLWSFHHIIMDGWCLSFIYRDFMYFYEQRIKGTSIECLKHQISEQRKVERKYEDYINWIDQQDRDAALEYWSNLLSGYETEAQIESTEIGVDNEEEVSSVNLDFSKNMTDEMKRFSISQGVTVSHIMECALAILLQRYSNSNDVVFGKVVSGRNANISGIESMVGLFINTVVERVTSNEDDTLKDLMHKIRNQALESEKYDYCALSSVQSNTNMGNRLINVLYVFENYYVDAKVEEEDNDIKIEIEDAREQTNYDLSISVTMGDVLSLRLIYNPQKYLVTEIERYMGQMEVIVKNIIEDCLQKVKSVNVLTQMERDIVCYDFNRTETRYPADTTMAEMFEEQVERIPYNIAVVYEEEKLTYMELNERANRVAFKLRKMGVKPNHLVAIIPERSVEMIVGILGILKAGGAYVPIDPGYPVGRIKYILEDCKPKVILTYNTQMMLSGNWKILDLSKKNYIFTKKTNPNRVNKSNDLAYVIYTSGTTGRPKGVLVEHNGVSNLREYFVREQNMTENDRTIQFASIAFDAMVSEICMSILVGACMYIPSEKTKMDTKKFEKYLIDNHITALILPPQYILSLHLKENIRTVITAGSETNKQIVNNYSINNRYSNDYGPTECTVCATHWEYEKNNIIPAKIPIGKPIANKQIFILNDKSLCGIGMPGELCVAGVGLAKGYLNQENLTAKKFIDNPFGKGRLYLTGDLARWKADGNIEYLGRIDEQVKIRGFRIELGEVENVIRNDSYVKDVAVIAKENKCKDKYLVAYVVGNDRKIVFEELREHISKDIPSYMIPSYFIQVEEIPINKNGKLDKNALPDVDLKGQREYVEPSSSLEKKLVQVFEEILGAKEIGINDTFLEMGGNSIQAIRTVAQMRSEGYEIEIKDLMKNATIYDIAKKLNKDEVDKQELQFKVSTELSEDIYNDENLFAKTLLSGMLELYTNNQRKSRVIGSYKPFAYQKYYLIEERENICNAKIVVTGNISEDKLISSIRKIICTQTAFRMTYDKEKDELLEYEYFEQWYIPYIDAAKGDLREYLRQSDSVHKLPSLFKDKELLSKVFVIKLKDDEHYIYFNIQHGVWDEVSTEILCTLIKSYCIDVEDDVANKNYSEYIDTKKKYENSFEKESDKFVAKFMKQIKTYDSLRRGREPEYYVEVTSPIDEMQVKRFLKNPILQSINIFRLINFKNARFQLRKAIPLIMLHFGRDEEDDFKNVGLYLNLIPLIYNLRWNKIKAPTKGKDINYYTKALYNPVYEMFRKTYLDIIPAVNFYCHFSANNEVEEEVEFNLEIKKNTEINISSKCSTIVRIVNNEIYMLIPSFDNNTERITKEVKKYIGKI